MRVEEIRRLCVEGSLEWTEHAVLRLIKRGICTDDVEKALLSGEIIEEYIEDYPFPSCLILGFSEKPLHVVCSVGDEKLWIITAYRPDLDKWSDDFRTRKEK